MAINRSVPGIKNSVQNDINWSFDEDFGVLAFELLAYDSVGDVVRRVTTDALNHFATNDSDKSTSSLYYEGLEDSGGNWQVVKTALDGGVMSNRYATQINNPLVTNYTSAWTSRATLTYDTYAVAF